MKKLPSDGTIVLMALAAGAIYLLGRIGLGKVTGTYKKRRTAKQPSSPSEKRTKTNSGEVRMGYLPKAKAEAWAKAQRAQGRVVRIESTGGKTYALFRLT